MAMEERVPNAQDGRKEERPPFFERRSGRILLFSSAGTFALFVIVFGSFYLRYARIIDQRLASGPFSGSIDIYTAPRSVAVGDPLTLQDVAGQLRRSGYTNPVTAQSTEEKVRRLVRRLAIAGRDAPVLLGMLRQILWKPDQS